MHLTNNINAFVVGRILKILRSRLIFADIFKALLPSEAVENVTAMNFVSF